MFLVRYSIWRSWPLSRYLFSHEVHMQESAFTLSSSTPLYCPDLYPRSRLSARWIPLWLRFLSRFLSWCRLGSFSSRPSPPSRSLGIKIYIRISVKPLRQCLLLKVKKHLHFWPVATATLDTSEKEGAGEKDPGLGTDLHFTLTLISFTFELWVLNIRVDATLVLIFASLCIVMYKAQTSCGFICCCFFYLSTKLVKSNLFFSFFRFFL